ncbi:MAG: STAS domain-containing protein [Chloroflexi bacterium]|nr:STAS domain-containing protein [Chloroflexota bacterium]
MDKFSVQSEVKAIPGDIKENAIVVTASGRIDSETAPAFDAELAKAVEINSRMVINLKGVNYMSSAGLRSITKAWQTAEKAGGAVRLAGVSESISSVMYTVGLNQKMASFASVDEAIASFG